VILACVVALIASTLTLFTGFGLGTLLLPALALQMDIVEAVAVTALVHLLNNLFKLWLVGRWARRDLVLWFGVPAMAAAFAGAMLLSRLGRGAPLDGPVIAGLALDPTPAELLIGVVIVVLAIRALRVPPPKDEQHVVSHTETVRTGLLSGFVGGLSGHQGAVRSAFLLRIALDRNSFVGTNVAIACMVDVARLAVYGTAAHAFARDQVGLWGPVTLSAFAGAWVGARLVRKTTFPALRVFVALVMIALGLAIATGQLGA
jgi:uncharacterized membrane protein YfcA